MSPRAALLISALLLAATPAMAAEPWDFPGGGAEEQEARKKFGNLFFQIYPGIERELGKKSPDVDEAITKLRLCIKIQPRGTATAEDRITNVRFAYFPYYMLAKAFVLKGRFDLAVRCVEKELADGAIASHALASEAQTMKRDLASLGALPLMKGWADTVLGWESGSAPISLLSGKPASLSEIRALRGQLDSVQPAAAKGIVDQLKAKITGLCAEEIKARRTLLDELRGDAWKDAMSGAAALPAGVCTAPAAGREAGDSIEEVGRCDQALTAALRTAGLGECNSLASLKSAVEAAAGIANASADAGGLPAACGSVKWKEAPVADLRRGFESLRKDRADSRRRHEKALKDLQQQLQTRIAGIREQVSQARAKLPADVPAQCVQDLLLGDAAREIARLRKDLDPERVQAGNLPTDLLAAEKLAGDAVEALAAQVRRGVEGLIREKGECPGVVTANLDSLAGLRDAYASRRQPADLATLCAKARAASNDLTTCWDKNVTLVQQKVGDYLGVVGAIAAARSEATPACVASSLEALRKRAKAPTGAGVAEWAKGAREAVGASQACLAESHAAVERQWSDVAGRVAASLGPLSSGTGPSGGGAISPEVQQIAKRVEAVAADLKRTGDRFKLLEPLFAADAGADAGLDLRGLLQKAGLSDGIGSTIWPVMEGARSRNDAALATEIVKVVRDAVAGPELRRAASALERFEPVAGKLTPFWALNTAFASFAAGDLDGAIRGLREEQGRGTLPAAGRGAAMVHATLSYFLSMKVALARSSGGAAATMLEQDAREQAGKACGAERGFAPPRPLLENGTFSEIFQRACT